MEIDTIMKFFDYIFFRSYKYYKRHNHLPMQSSVIIVMSEILSLTSWLFVSLSDYLLPKLPKHGYAITLIVYLLFYYRYHKKKNIIFQEFKNSKYNKSITDWMCIWGTLIPSIILGWILIAIASSYNNRHHLSGILWPYIEPYLGRFIY